VTVVSDAGPLIHLSRVGYLPLLRDLFGTVVIPRGVEWEVLAAQPGTPGLDSIRIALGEGWLAVSDVEASETLEQLVIGLDSGEAEALILARQMSADAILIDDLRGRLRAEELGLTVVGTVGILRLARGLGWIERAYPILERLRALDFRVSDFLIERAREEEV